VSNIHYLYIYIISHDFRKIIGCIKIFDKCTSDVVAHGVRLLPPHRTALGVPTAAGHGGTEPPTVGSTGRWAQYLMSWPTASGNHSAKGHGVRNLPPWAAAAAPSYIRDRAPCRQPPLLPSNLRLSTSSERF
jgi:hypothetical protein